jgi:predicted ester cyclase
MKTLNIFNIICLSGILFTSEVKAQNYSKEVPVPKSITIDKGLPRAIAEAEKAAALNFYAFWNTGNAAYLKKAVATDFTDNTLPEGRPQGINGLIYARKKMGIAIPDLRCELQDILITGDKVTARMVFIGTHKGELMGQQGTGKKVRFFAIDILHMKNGKIFEDWHIEDNLTLLKQVGLLK